MLHDALVLAEENALTAALATHRVADYVVVAVHLVEETVACADSLQGELGQRA